jgi:hypothetical protein
MIREVIEFRLVLGARMDVFRARLPDVLEAMARAGVAEPKMWTDLAGEARSIYLEREFGSLADYEKDDVTFHNDADLMATWRGLEECLAGMSVAIRQQLRAPGQRT